MTTQVKIFHYFLACLLAWAGISMTLAEDTSCAETGETHIWISPINPKANTQVKIMAVSTDGRPASELALIDSRGRRMSLQYRRRGGPPWSLSVALESFKEGNYRVMASRDDKLTACRPLTIGGSGTEEKPKAWGLATEAFYSAWIEALFGAPPGKNLSFPSLESVLRNPERNFMHS